MTGTHPAAELRRVRAAGRRPQRSTGWWEVLAVVALGGALGSLARHGLSVALPAERGGFVLATLLANAGGCLLIGALMALITESGAPHRLLRPAVGVGFLGGFTTLSTYLVESIESVHAGHPVLAAAYLLGSLLACMLATLLGMLGARAVLVRARTGDHE